MKIKSFWNLLAIHRSWNLIYAADKLRISYITLMLLTNRKRSYLDKKLEIDIATNIKSWKLIYATHKLGIYIHAYAIYKHNT